MIDSTAQRINMVESQVRPSDVTDRRILRAMLDVPREAFVPEARRALAYMDAPVQVAPASGGGPARTLLAPRTFAKLVQLAEITPASIVLDVGCATGYSTAILARLAKAVVAVEVDAGLAAQARQTLSRQQASNAIVIEGSLAAGAPAHAPFDAILLNGAAEQVPDALLGQLKDGARLVGVLADGPAGRGQVWWRRGAGFDSRPVFDSGADPLPGFARQREFTF
jgi:protein-L-isoaspartate(D-aspartate) O-methyltransferase